MPFRAVLSAVCAVQGGSVGRLRRSGRFRRPFMPLRAVSSAVCAVQGGSDRKKSALPFTGKGLGKAWKCPKRFGKGLKMSEKAWERLENVRKGFKMSEKAWKFHGMRPIRN